MSAARRSISCTSTMVDDTIAEVLESKGQVGLITYKARADFDDFVAYQP